MKGFVAFAYDPIGQGEREQTFLPQLGRAVVGWGRERASREAEPYRKDRSWPRRDEIPYDSSRFLSGSLKVWHSPVGSVLQAFE
jgi:hypothetical protein